MKQSYLYLSLVIAMFLWGMSWPTSKILSFYANVEFIVLWRFFFVLVGSLPILLFLKISLKISKKTLKWLFIAGGLNALYAFIFFLALRYGTAGKGGVLVTTMVPIFSYLFLFLGFKKSYKLSKYEIFGLFIGIISGLFLLNLNSLEELFGRFNVLFLLCAFIWALMSLCTHKTKGEHPLAVNFYVNGISFLFFTPLLLNDESFFILEADMKFWLNMFVVAFLSTVVGTSIYYYGIHILGNVRANSFILITPASALLTSFLILNEVPTTLTLVGGALAIVAIYFMGKKGKA
ncbi:DMT family transporter [Campylobacter upsaliensis]|mgnify:CR=1 FL=1|uniref:DMT family transporter n=1 Tax=Campylobacter upsaliensis TaxID=28080 RepID=UPI001DA98611|nr:DMT family transporter [Campylobacter upsaliensis]EHE0558316.1 DMT family transporter [Campylobacter upsaliensis]MCR2098153.1 DMT family transporter [Campylobacter upsaliensis]